MHQNEELFEYAEGSSEPPYEEPLVTDNQIASIRNTFDDAKITSMKERRELIEEVVMRPVANVRDLYARDVRRVIHRIKAKQHKRQPEGGSAWDNRDEDTWIDKL